MLWCRLAQSWPPPGGNVSVWVCLRNWGGKDATGMYWAEARNAARHPPMHRTARNKELCSYLVPTVPRLKTLPCELNVSVPPKSIY